MGEAMVHMGLEHCMRLMLVFMALLAAAFSQDSSIKVSSTTATKKGISAPLKEAPARQNKAGARALRQEHVVKPIPHKQGTMKVGLSDRAAQKRAALFPFPATISLTKEGVGAENYPVNSDPPDTVGAPGTTQYVQWVNTAVQVFDKNSLAPISSVLDGNFLWHGFGGNCEMDNDGDPIVLFDRRDGGHWLLSQFSITKQPYSQCIAVSQTDDALGKYNLYEFQFDAFNDYGKFAIWPNGYYASFNMFGVDAQGNDAFQGSKVCAFDRGKMIVGETATMQCFDTPQNGGLLVADLDGSTAPPDGTPAFVFGIDVQGKSVLHSWRYAVDWSDPTKSSVTPDNPVAVQPYTIACDSCVQQPSTASLPNPSMLDTLSDRLMFRVTYRQRGNLGSLLLNHSVANQARVAIRWYELQTASNGGVTVTQTGTYAPDKTYRWMGSLAGNKAGDILLGYSASSSTISPSIRIAGRRSTDAPNALSSEAVIKVGKGSQGSLSRWGDYSAMQVDPVDDCSFYYTTLYLSDSGSYQLAYRNIQSHRFAMSLGSECHPCTLGCGRRPSQMTEESCTK